MRCFPESGRATVPVCDRKPGKRDIRDLGKKLNERFQGRGGGKPGMIQGSLTGEEEEVKAFFEEIDQCGIISQTDRPGSPFAGIVIPILIYWANEFPGGCRRCRVLIWRRVRRSCYACV